MSVDQLAKQAEMTKMNKDKEKRPGYQKTKLGWLPVEWEVSSVGKAFKICNSGRKPLSAHVRQKMQGIYPYYGPTKIQDYINEYQYEGEYALIAEDGDHFLKYADKRMTQLATGQFNVNNHAHVIEGKSKVSTTKWFYWFFYHRNIFSHLTRQGAGRYKLNKAALGKLPVALPPLPEQQKIATILSTWDRAIALTRQLLQEKEAQKKGLMQRLLTGKVRVKGFEGEWDVLELGQLFSLSSGKTKPNNTRSSSTKNINKPVYGGNGIMGYTDKSLLSGDKILIGRVGEYCGCVHVANGDYWVTDNCLFTKEFHHSTSINFLAYFLDFKQLKRFRNKGGQPLISQKSILKLKFPIPQIKEQTAIAAILTQADEEIRLLREKERALQAQKKGLMQRLLTGKVRVKVD